METTRDKLKDPISNINYVVDPEQQNLIYERAKAKNEVDLELEYVTPLLKLDPKYANNVASRANNSIKNVKSNVKIFKAVHGEYIKKIK